jgi:hypothetical protein
MSFVIRLERVQLRVGVQYVLDCHHIGKAVRATHGGIILRAQGEDLLVFVLGKKGAHRRVGKQDLCVMGREGGEGESGAKEER